MIKNFEELENAITALGTYIDQLTKSNAELKNNNEALTNTLKDRDQEILQLQQEVKDSAVKASDETTAVFEKRIEGLLGRVRSMTPHKDN